MVLKEMPSRMDEWSDLEHEALRSLVGHEKEGNNYKRPCLTWKQIEQQMKVAASRTTLNEFYNREYNRTSIQVHWWDLVKGPARRKAEWEARRVKKNNAGEFWKEEDEFLEEEGDFQEEEGEFLKEADKHLDGEEEYVELEGEYLEVEEKLLQVEEMSSKEKSESSKEKAEGVA